MINRATKLRWRRKIRKQQRQVEDAGAQAEANLERHLFRRLSRLTRVRRFIASWVLLVGLLAFGSLVQLRGLSQYYQEAQPAPGGTYTEGIIGTFTTANPLYATNAVDRSDPRLVFYSLMKYNENKLSVKKQAYSQHPNPTINKTLNIQLLTNVTFNL
jgi:hypothetical protein